MGHRLGKPLNEKSFREIVAGAGADWITSNLSIDAEVFQSVFALRAAMRDLWRCNPYLAKFQEHLAANVLGEAGIMLRSKVTETEDRVVNTPDEKWALLAHERRINDLREKAALKRGTPFTDAHRYRIMHFADALERSSTEHIMRGTATIQVGAPDVYANQRIESWWKELNRAENIDVRQVRDGNALRQIALWATARDGGHFLHMVKDPNVNAFGFALQPVNDEWVDHFYNVTLDNGNVVRLGIEYQMNSWGIGKPIAYHFIKRQARDWQYGTGISGRFSGNSYMARDRIPAEEVIHVARFLDNESTRPAPWGISMLGKVRQLDQYEIAEVVAARAEACKTGWLESTVNPEGGLAGLNGINPDPRQAAGINVTPGGLYGLPWGVTYKANNPTHPSGNFQNFRQGMGQSISAGLPGADYNTVFNDLANINFSAGRLGRLDTNEINKMLQRWFINKAETPIFENALEMGLIVGALPFRFSKEKFKKLNKPVLQGRRWEQVDEGKAVDAAAKRIANKLSSRNKECAERGIDFEDNAFELAEEDNLLEELGLRQETTAQDPASPEQLITDDDTEEDPETGEPLKPKNGKKHSRLTGVPLLS